MKTITLLIGTKRNINNFISSYSVTKKQIIKDSKIIDPYNTNSVDETSVKNILEIIINEDEFKDVKDIYIIIDDIKVKKIESIYNCFTKFMDTYNFKFVGSILGTDQEIQTLEKDGVLPEINKIFGGESAKVQEYFEDNDYFGRDELNFGTTELDLRIFQLQNIIASVREYYDDTTESNYESSIPEDVHDEVHKSILNVLRSFNNTFDN